MSSITAELIKRQSKQYDCEVVARLNLEKQGKIPFGRRLSTNSCGRVVVGSSRFVVFCSLLDSFKLHTLLYLFLLVGALGRATRNLESGDVYGVD